MAKTRMQSGKYGNNVLKVIGDSLRSGDMYRLVVSTILSLNIFFFKILFVCFYDQHQHISFLHTFEEGSYQG